MIEYKIFYSWQNDAPKKVNRTFILGAISDAVESIRSDDASIAFDILDADRIDLDEGMDGVSGSPEVATIMFEKIGESGIFIGDMTLVAQSKPEVRPLKQLPNANVAVELGFAAGVLGWPRVICVMNEAYGTRNELPLDVRNRRFPINYTLRADSGADEEIRIRSELVRDFQRAIRGVRENDLRKAEKVFEKLDVHLFELAHALSEMPSFYQPEKEDPSQAIVALKDHEVFRQCILRLLDLGMVRIAAEKARYAYHWTFLGREVLKFVRRASHLG